MNWLYKIIDGENHWASANTPARALELVAETFGYTAAEFEEDCGPCRIEQHVGPLTINYESESDVEHERDTLPPDTMVHVEYLASRPQDRRAKAIIPAHRTMNMPEGFVCSTALP
jgi:hypothetical protein